MRRVVVSGVADREFRGAVAYVARRNPLAARALARRLDAAKALLGRRPELGREHPAGGPRVWHVAGTRYTLIYRFDDATVTVLRIWHGARGWPPAD